MKSENDLRELLKKIDHRGYPGYKETRGQYQFRDYILSIDHVQGDPFASPSSVSIRVDGKKAGFPAKLYDTPEKKYALEDRLLRAFGRNLRQGDLHVKGSGKSGAMYVSRPGQEVLQRSACVINEKTGSILVRLRIGFPAQGRTICSGELEKILFGFLPGCVGKSLFYRSLNHNDLEQAAQLAEDQTYIRQELQARNLTAFVADGSILPRESGVSDRPMKGAVRFESPESLRVTMDLPNAGEITGMGIPQGITLIVGGGYHGKSTLLKALETGVYNHIAGDGREYVIIDETAMKLRAEDGRSIRNVDISMFINHLPNGKDTVSFSTEDASGSTSQAANTVEAIEAGTHVFLIDEDTSATNFMIRDELMQRVVSPEVEPITPFIDRVEELYHRDGISTILVAGSSGAYFYKADVIIQMNQYRPHDITEFAKREAEKYAGTRNENAKNAVQSGSAKTARTPDSAVFAQTNRVLSAPKALRTDDRMKIRTSGLDTISVNHDDVDVRYVEQLVHEEQLAALGELLEYAIRNNLDGKTNLMQVAYELNQLLETKGFDALAKGGYLSTDMARPRIQEIMAVLNRCRFLK